MPETSDSPGAVLHIGYQEVTRTDSFTTTLMFQSSNVGSATFVPIASGGWGWRFDATSSDGGSTWNLINSGYNGGPAPATTTFPYWTYNLTSCVFN